MKRIEEIYESTVVEKDEHRKSKEYRKLSPKMKDAVDSIFKVMDAKPSDFEALRDDFGSSLACFSCGFLGFRFWAGFSSILSEKRQKGQN